MIKIYCGMVCFLGFPWEKNFCCLFGYIWVKIHFPLTSLFVDFNEILVHSLCRKQRIINGRKNNIFTKKSKGPSIESCEPSANTDDQFEGWPLRTTLWNLSLWKLWKKFVQIVWNSKSLVCIIIPCVRPYQRLLRCLRS